MKILLVEDELELAKFLKQSLESEYFSVDSCHDGEKGLFMARVNDYDLVILDHGLPGILGSEIIKELRKEKPNLPIIMLTVRAALEDKLEAFNLGADDYLTKPFLFSELLARIKAVLKRPPVTEKKILKVDDLSLNIDKHHVSRGGKSIYLTRKEMMLLEFLIKNKGKVMSRSSILENVWEADADPFSNTIESHVLNLRKKINLKDKIRLIHTVIGRGYKLDTKR